MDVNELVIGEQFYPHAINETVTRTVLDSVTKTMVPKITIRPVIVQSAKDHMDRFPEDFVKFAKEVGVEPPQDVEKQLAAERKKCAKVAQAMVQDWEEIPIEKRKALVAAINAGNVPQQAATAANK